VLPGPQARGIRRDSDRTSADRGPGAREHSRDKAADSDPARHGAAHSHPTVKKSLTRGATGPARERQPDRFERHDVGAGGRGITVPVGIRDRAAEGFGRTGAATSG
jgi:hypothetical protein